MLVRRAHRVVAAGDAYRPRRIPCWLLPCSLCSSVQLPCLAFFSLPGKAPRALCRQAVQRSRPGRESPQREPTERELFVYFPLPTHTHTHRAAQATRAMGPGDITIKDNKLQKELMLSECSLIRIPPPRSQSQKDKVDISNWDLTAIVWRGRLRFYEEEQLNGQGTMEGVLELINYDKSVFVDVRCSSDVTTVQSSDSPRCFGIIVDVRGDKYAFGLMFDDKDTGEEFSIALQDFRRDLATLLEAQREQMEDLSINVKDDEFGDYVGTYYD